jgi:adenosylcobinamide-GDP ribazoletransferase
VACLARLLDTDAGWLALPAATVAGRVAMARTGVAGTPIAAGSSLGQAVAGTVSRRWLAGLVAVTAAAAVAAPVAAGRDLTHGLLLLAAVAVGWLAAAELLRRARARLGGVNGDVMGALGEVTTAGTLLAAAVLLP